MDVFELAAVSTIVQVAIWLALVAIKTLNRIRQKVTEKRKSRGTLKK